MKAKRVPWNLIWALLGLALLGLFALVNLGNSCDLSLGLWRLKGLPVSLCVISAFALGFLFSYPIRFAWKRAAKKRKAAKEASRAAGQGDEA